MKEKFGVNCRCYEQGSYGEKLQYEYVEVWSQSYPTELQIRVAVNAIYNFYDRVEIDCITQLTNNAITENRNSNANNIFHNEISELKSELNRKQKKIENLEKEIEKYRIDRNDRIKLEKLYQLQIDEIKSKAEHFIKLSTRLSLFILDKGFIPPKS